MAPIQLSEEQAKAIGKRLRTARRHAGYYRQEELAEAAGLSLSYISKLESGNLVPKDDQVYRQLGEQLGVSLDWLLTGQVDAVDCTQPSLAPNPAAGTADLRQIVQRVYELIQDPEAYRALEVLAGKQHTSIVEILVSLVRQQSR